jgi:hypothetical protein
LAPAAEVQLTSPGFAGLRLYGASSAALVDELSDRLTQRGVPGGTCAVLGAMADVDATGALTALGAGSASRRVGLIPWTAGEAVPYLFDATLKLATPNSAQGGGDGPTLRPGAIVQVDRSADLDSLRPAVNTTFDNTAAKGMRVTHRITGVERRDSVSTGFRTKGDANTASDSKIVPVENIEGVPRLVVPFAGLPRGRAVQRIHDQHRHRH